MTKSRVSRRGGILEVGVLLLGVVRPNVWCPHRSMSGQLVMVVVGMFCEEGRSERAQGLSFIPDSA